MWIWNIQGDFAHLRQRIPGAKFQVSIDENPERLVFLRSHYFIGFSTGVQRCGNSPSCAKRVNCIFAMTLLSLPDTDTTTMY